MWWCLSNHENDCVGIHRRERCGFRRKRDDSFESVMGRYPLPEGGCKLPLACVRRHDKRQPSIVIEQFQSAQKKVDVQARAPIERSANESSAIFLQFSFQEERKAMVADVGRIGDDSLEMPRRWVRDEALHLYCGQIFW